MCAVHGFESRSYTLQEEEGGRLISTFRLNVKGSGITQGISQVFSGGHLETQSVTAGIHVLCMLTQT